MKSERRTKKKKKKQKTKKRVSEEREEKEEEEKEEERSKRRTKTKKRGARGERRKSDTAENNLFQGDGWAGGRGVWRRWWLRGRRGVLSQEEEVAAVINRNLDPVAKVNSGTKPRVLRDYPRSETNGIAGAPDPS